MCSLIRFWREIQKFKSCRVWSCFLRNFIVAKKSKNVEIVFSIPKAKSGSISIKIRQPLFWTDPYLPDLAFGMLKTISTFLDFFATIKFLKKQLQSLQLLNFWISRQNLIRLHNDLRSIFFWLHYWLRGYVGALLAFRPGDWGSNLSWAKLFFPYIDKIFQMKAISYFIMII